MNDTWLAIFQHPQHPWRNFEHSFPRSHQLPPAAIRTPSLLAGMPAYDVYLLSDSTAWPAAATFTYTESVLGSLADTEPVDHTIDM
ncbi:MAG: hypothetical protein AAGC66_00305 [Leifsonia sp.]